MRISLATVISAVVIGLLLLVAGASEVVHAFSAPHWRGFAFWLVIGALYGICGAALIADPLFASVVLTFVFALALIVSGVVRVFQAFQYWRWYGSLRRRTLDSSPAFVAMDLAARVMSPYDLNPGGLTRFAMFSPNV